MGEDGVAAIDQGGFSGGATLNLPLQVESVSRPSPGIRRVTAIVTREDVFKGIKRDPEPLRLATGSATGKYWLMGHPEKGTELEWPKNAIGESISSEFVPGVNKLRVTSDFYEDRLDPDLLDRLDRKEPIEVSVGYRATLVPENGTWRGKTYHAKETELEITHLAIVPAGACSWPLCGLGLHDEDDLAKLSDEELTQFFDHQIGQLVKLRSAGCDQTARYHCRHDLARALREHDGRGTKPLRQTITTGGDERLLAIDEARAWYVDSYGNHSEVDPIDGSGEMAETKGNGDGDGGRGGGGDLLEIGSTDQLEAILNQAAKVDDDKAKIELYKSALERLLADAKGGKGMFAKPKEEGEHSAGEPNTVEKKVFLKPVISVEGGHEEGDPDVATVTFETTEDEAEAKNAVEGIVSERNKLAADKAESDKTIAGIKDKLGVAEDAKKAAETKVREGLMDRLRALPGMDDEAIKAYDEMDNATLENVVMTAERVHAANVGEEGAVSGEHSADGGRQKTKMRVQAGNGTGTGYDFATTKKEYDAALGRS